MNSKFGSEQSREFMSNIGTTNPIRLNHLVYVPWARPDRGALKFIVTVHGLKLEIGK